MHLESCKSAWARLPSRTIVGLLLGLCFCVLPRGEAQQINLRTQVKGTLVPANGGIGVAPSGMAQIPVSASATQVTYQPLPQSCPADGLHAINFSMVNGFTCQAITGGGGGGGGTPAGPTSALQFNQGGAFGPTTFLTDAGSHSDLLGVRNITALTQTVSGTGAFRALNTTDPVGGVADASSVTFAAPSDPLFPYHILQPRGITDYGVGLVNGNFEGALAKGEVVPCNFYKLALTDCSNREQQNYHIDDSFTSYDNFTGFCGFGADGDEGCGGPQVQIRLGNINSKGTITAFTNAGATTIADNGVRTVDGTWIVDTTPAAVSTATFTGPPVPLAVFPNIGVYPVAGANFPVLTSLAYCTTPINPTVDNVAKSRGFYTTTSVTCTVQPIGGVYHPLTATFSRIGGNNNIESGQVVGTPGAMDPDTHQQTVSVYAATDEESFVLTQGPGFDGMVTLDQDVEAQALLLTGAPALGAIDPTHMLITTNVGGITTPSIMRTGVAKTDGTSAAAAHFYHGAEIIGNGPNGENPTLALTGYAWAGKPYANVLFAPQQLHGSLVVLASNTLPDQSLDTYTQQLALSGNAASGPAKILDLINPTPYYQYLGAANDPLAHAILLPAPSALTVEGAFARMFKINEAPQTPDGTGLGCFICVLHSSNYSQGDPTLESTAPWDVVNVAQRTPLSGGSYYTAYVRVDPAIAGMDVGPTLSTPALIADTANLTTATVGTLTSGTGGQTTTVEPGSVTAVTGYFGNLNASNNLTALVNAATQQFLYQGSDGAYLRINSDGSGNMKFQAFGGTASVDMYGNYTFHAGVQADAPSTLTSATFTDSIDGENGIGVQVSSGAALQVTDAAGGAASLSHNGAKVDVTSGYVTIGATQQIYLAAGTQATSGGNVSSVPVGICGSYWNGTAVARDCWDFQNVLTFNGATPVSTLALGHQGSAGPSNVALPAGSTDGGKTLCHSDGSGCAAPQIQTGTLVLNGSGSGSLTLTSNTYHSMPNPVCSDATPAPAASPLTPRCWTTLSGNTATLMFAGSAGDSINFHIESSN